MISLYFQSFRRHVACTIIDRCAYVLIAVPPGLTRKRLATICEDIVSQAERAMHIGFRVGLGREVQTLAQVAISREDADRVVHVFSHFENDQRVLAVEDVQSEITLLDLQQVPALGPDGSGKARLLAELDATQGTNYVQTLRAYLEANGSIPRSSESLGIHPNTLRYRLARAAELAALDLDNPTERLVLQLQLRFLASPRL